MHTRKQKVIIVSQEDIYVISLTNEQLNKGEEIEQSIVNNLIEKHQIFIQSTQQCECWWIFCLYILNKCIYIIKCILMYLYWINIKYNVE